MTSLLLEKANKLPVKEKAKLYEREVKRQERIHKRAQEEIQKMLE
jgi:hypothetical protein